jgi:hypothetical protein
MKILSSFDTELVNKLYEVAIWKFWVDRVLVLTKARLYLLIKVIMPMLWIFLMLIGVSLVFNSVSRDLWEAWGRMLVVLLFMVVLIFIFPILRSVIDYNMDFILITPEFISFYNQEWIFTRSNKTLDASKIKTINSQKPWIVRSFFDVGDLLFLSEWNDQFWDIIFPYVHDPEVKQQKILDIIESNRE